MTFLLTTPNVIGRGILVLAGYYLAAKLGLAFAFENESISAIWIPSGLAVAATFLWGYRVLPAVLLGATLANLSTDAAEWTAPVIGLGNTAEAFAGAWLLHRLRFDATLERTRDTGALIVAGLVAPIVSASVGIAALSYGLGFWLAPSDWLLWWGGDATGLLLFGAAIFVLFRNRRPLTVRGSLLVIPTVTVAALVTTLSPLALPVLSILIGVIGGLRGPKSVALAAVLASSILVVAASQGNGVFGEGADVSLLRIQAVVALISITALLGGSYARGNGD